jgi:gas vesicle protein
MNSKIFNIIFVLTLFAVLPACSVVPLTPSQTAQQFWGAIIADDAESASRFATPSSGPEFVSIHKDWRGATVTFGEVRIASEQASVETTLEISQVNSPTKTDFTTHLLRVHDSWRVDLLETKKSLDNARDRRGLGKLVDDLEKLGRDISGQLNNAMKNWEDMQPEIKQDLQELGESIQEDVQGAIDKYGPEIEKKLQDLNESLEEALKELEKAVPQQQPQPEPPEQPEGRMI